MTVTRGGAPEPTDLAAELDRLDQEATSSPWALFEADPESEPLRPVFNPDGDLELIAEPTWMPDAELIVWLRNHTDEIKAALADEGWDQAMCDEYIVREHTDLVAERDRLRETIAGSPEKAKRLVSLVKSSTRLVQLERDDARAERDQLRATLGRVEELRTRMTEHAEPHVPADQAGGE